MQRSWLCLDVDSCDAEQEDTVDDIETLNIPLMPVEIWGGKLVDRSQNVAVYAMQMAPQGCISIPMA